MSKTLTISVIIGLIISILTAGIILFPDFIQSKISQEGSTQVPLAQAYDDIANRSID